MTFELDYDAPIPLDAEDLAEMGIGEAYTALAPILARFVAVPAILEERIDEKVGSYSVVGLGTEYPGTTRSACCGRATAGSSSASEWRRSSSSPRVGD
jgi:hypothetical protein